MSDLPVSMQVIEATGPGGPEVLHLGSAPLPSVPPGCLLVRVQAAGVNRVDCQQRRGTYAPPPGASATLGVEIAGEVVALGEGVQHWQVGDRVCALVDSGGYAEYCVAPQRQCLRWPERFDAVRAAALPEAFFTVWANLFATNCLRAGEVLLVHGGSSGIGTTAIQLARARGARVLATAGNAAKCAACVQLGAGAAIDYRSEDFVARVKELTDRRGVDVILDLVGGPYLARNLACLAPRGRLVIIAFQGGTIAEQFDLRPVVIKHLTITGSTLRPRSVDAKGELADALAREVWPLLDAGTLAPVIDSTYPLGRAAEAHARMEASVHIGKIVLEVG